MLSTTCSLKWLNELQHEILSQLIICFTLGITESNVNIQKVRSENGFSYSWPHGCSEVFFDTLKAIFLRYLKKLGIDSVHGFPNIILLIFSYFCRPLYFCGTFALRDQDFKITYVPITQPRNTCQYL